MAQNADVIIIGTGVIGSATAFELAKRGYKTLSVDRNRQIGHGSTAGSCAIIRMHYSTFDGTAFAWEGYHYWRDWAEYLGLDKSHELAKFKQCGCLVMKTPENDFMQKHIENSHTLNIPIEEWDADRITEKLPIYDLQSYAPPKRMEDEGFARPNGGHIHGGVYWPLAGYVTDPALSAQNLAAAAGQNGAEVMLGVEVTEILQEGGKVTGVRLGDGRTLNAPILVNIAGRVLPI